MSSLNEKLRRLPSNPGCYLFKDRQGTILYVGKAKNLRKRVRSYFNRQLNDPKTNQLVQAIADFEFIIVDSELEALLLEAKLIARHQPNYNLDLKGGVRYAYIRVTDEPFPRLETARLIGPRDTVFGPFAVGENRKQLIWLANDLFKLLAGKMPALIKQLEAEMRQFSEREQYELAKIRRDQVTALRSLAERQKVQLKKRYDQDVISTVMAANTFFVQLFNINRGVVSGHKKFTFPFQRLGSDPSHWLERKRK